MRGEMTADDNALRHDFKLQKNPGYKSGNFISGKFYRKEILSEGEFLRRKILSDYHLHENGGVLNG